MRLYSIGATTSTNNSIHQLVTSHPPRRRNSLSRSEKHRRSRPFSYAAGAILFIDRRPPTQPSVRPSVILCVAVGRRFDRLGLSGRLQGGTHQALSFHPTVRLQIQFPKLLQCPSTLCSERLARRYRPISCPLDRLRISWPLHYAAASAEKVAAAVGGGATAGGGGGGGGSVCIFSSLTLNY